MKTNINVELIDELIKQRLPKSPDKVLQAVEYSLFSGGKRFRPMLLLATTYAVSKKLNDNAKTLACALEFIHTYSLIHDDLPCMDNDDVRRGKRSCHMQFGEASAVLAGDALLNLAIETVFSGNLCNEKYRKASAYLFKMSGTGGMLLGQSLDLFSETKTMDDANAVALHKTGDLIRAAIVCGALCGGVKDEEIPVFDEIACKLGIAYQVVDDLLDAEKCEKSFLDVMSERACGEYAEQLTKELKTLCDKLPYDMSFVEQIAEFNLSRKR